MRQSEKALPKEEQKAKIRERYKGVDTDILEVIPAKKKADFYDNVKRRVGVYVRVSTDGLQQTSSYELQKNYYEDKVNNNENWELVKIYADEGISGTSLKKRDAFNEMIADCKAGKMDMIITKSVSRFARNIVDCVSIVRELALLKNPIGVFFETENIFTLNDSSEMALSFTATMAQEESHTKSSIMNASIEMRFSHGIVLTPVLLGYDHDENGELVINEEEALTVRLIFFMYLYGYTCQQIAETLTKLKRQTKKGNTTWSGSTVGNLLRNERYCGDVLTRKTYTPNYLDHKAKKNMGDRTQHRWRDHHEPIISRDDYIAVQHMLDNARFGGRGVMPELKVIEAGAFKGFVGINTHWIVFGPEDYRKASRNVYGGEKTVETGETEDYEIKAKEGDFDLRGFEIARSQFFETKNRLTVTFSSKGIIFSASCVQKMPERHNIEIFVHPDKKLMFIRACAHDCKNAIRWTRLRTGKYVPKQIPGTAFLSTIFSLFDWNEDCKYRFQGVKKQQGKNTVIVFDLNEEEMLIPTSTVNPSVSEVSTSEIQPYVPQNGSLVAFPSEWNDEFGNDYYIHGEQQDKGIETKKWSPGKTGTYTNIPIDNVTNSEVVATNIETLINTMKEARKDG